LEKKEKKAGTQNIPAEKQIRFTGGLSGHHSISHRELTVLPNIGILGHEVKNNVKNPGPEDQAFDVRINTTS
jgi:hypothetical protein